MYQNACASQAGTGSGPQTVGTPVGEAACSALPDSQQQDSDHL